MSDNTEVLHDSVGELFTEIKQPTQQQEPQAQTEEVQTGAGKQITDEPTEPEPSPEMLNSGADIALAFFDFSQSSIFRFLVNRRKNARVIDMFGENALTKLSTLLNREEANNSKGTTTLHMFNDEEQAMLRIAHSAQEIIKELPMSDSEKDMLKVPLMEIMKKKGGTIPPEYMLLLGIAQVIGARATQMYMM